MTSIDQELCPPRYADPVWVSTGGMGDLYRAVDLVLNRVVAIKLLTQRLASDDDVRKRFRREALAAARLSDEPNTVTIFDVGEWQGRPFIVMEYLGGGTLEQVLRSGAQPTGRALAWIEQAAAALDAAHARGIVHRDVKPANLLLDEHARIRVADFGIATAAGLDSLTLTGTILGTAGYLSPEQAQGHAVTPAADRYALGVVAFELLTGTRPFHRDSVTAEAAAHAYAIVPSAAEQRPALPAAVDAVFERALAKQPAERFPSCASFAAALHAACRQEAEAVTRRIPVVSAPVPPTTLTRRRWRRPPLLAAGAVAALLAGGGVTAFLLGADGGPTAAPTVVKTVTRSTSPTTTSKTTTAATSAGSQTSAGASDLNTRGYRLILAGNYSAALPLLQQAVAGLTDPANPVTAYANFNLGQTLVRLGRCGEAMPYLQRALQLEPSSQQVHAAVAYAEQCAGTGATAAAHVPPGHGGAKRHKDHGGHD
jgi:serine/threonine protein kinase